ncbi:MAG: ATP-binding cassette domain-containing protein, partial [Promethearchaeota archaeon]
RAVTLSGYSIDQLSEVPFSELECIMKKLEIPKALVDLAGPAHDAILRRLAFLKKVGLGYLHLNRIAGTLSAGEAQRAKLAGLLGSGLTSLTVLLDEPTRGMHPSEVEALVDALMDLKNEGNSIVIVEHDPEVIKAAEHIIDMGPKAGSGGGRVVAEGTLKEISKKNTVTSKWLSGRRAIRIPENRREPQEWLEIRGAKENNLTGELVRIPLGVVVGICGPSGSGKSTLLVDTIGRALSPRKITTSVAYEPIAPGEHKSIVGAPQKTIVLDQSRRGINNPGQFLDVFTHLTRIYSESEDASALGMTSAELSSSCSSCEGRGLIRTEMGFLPTVFSSCDTCNGTGLRPEAWEVHVNGIPYPKLGELTIDEAYDLFGDDEGLRRILSIAQSVGLGYLVLHQPSHTISAGEIQRLRIAKELSRKAAGPTLYVWDEPSLGQHMEDVARLVDVLRGITEKGHSVVIIEHHPHILAACDWLIELGPGGGPEGGRIVAEGTPETIAAGSSRTAAYIRDTLEGRL